MAWRSGNFPKTAAFFWRTLPIRGHCWSVTFLSPSYGQSLLRTFSTLFAVARALQCP